jgi:eukaryotic-like serine/threonine-protein kinase
MRLRKQRLLRPMAFIAALALLMQVGTSSPVPAQDSWTSFRNGPQQLGIAEGTLPENLELLWEHPAPDGVSGTAAIAGGRTYVGTIGGKLLCLELRTGKVVWEYRSLKSEDPNAFLPGFQTPVTLTDELVLAGDEDGTLHAVDRETGRQRWSVPTDGEVVGGATVIDDRVIFGSHAQRLFCRKLSDGSPVWEADTQGPVNGSPAIGNGQTFVTGCDQPVLRVLDVETGDELTTIDLEGLLIATPALKDSKLYFGTSDGIVFAVDARQRSIEWKYSDEDRKFEIHSSPAVTDELVIIGSRNKRLHAVNRKTGQPEWTFATRGGIDSSPVVAGERVYFGSKDKAVYGVSLADGSEVWKFNAAQPISASPAIAQGCLVIGTDAANGRILCFGAK